MERRRAVCRAPFPPALRVPVGVDPYARRLEWAGAELHRAGRSWWRVRGAINFNQD